MWRKALCAAVSLLPIALGVSAQGLRPSEKKLIQIVQAGINDELAALEKVVNIDSGTYNLAGVKEVGRYFQQEFEALGFKTRWVPMPDSMHRAGHLLAERVAPRATGRRLLLVGHLDTVFEGSGHRFNRDGDTIRGAGIMDMKGGDIVVLFALKALKGAGMLEGATIRVFLTGDEESPGAPTDVSRRELVEAGRQSDIALAFEPDTVKILVGKRGLSTWSLQTTGVQGHSMNVLRAKGGAGAIYEASRILDALQRTYSGHPTITVNPGHILGGTDVSYDADRSSGTSAGKFNVVARTATVIGDIRFVSDKERDEAKARMLEIAGANLPKTTAKLVFEDLVPGWPATDGNRAVLAVVDKVSRDLGYGPLEADDPAQRGFGDFNFVGSLLSGVDGLGLKGEGFHAPDERIKVESLGPATSRAAVLISRLLQQPK